MKNVIICPVCGKRLSTISFYDSRKKAQTMYYYRNREKILEKAKQRRIADPEYRKKLNQYQLDRYYKQKEARDVERLTNTTNP